MIIEVNNIKCKIHVEKRDPRFIFRKLRTFMSMKAHNYHRSERFQDGLWDGEVNFVTDAGYFATGLLPIVLKYLTNINCEYVLEDNRNNIVNVNTTDIIYKLSDKVTLFPYQQEGVNKILKLSLEGNPWIRGVVDAATNAGKDYMMACIHINLNVNTVMIIHNADIFRKAIKFFSKYFEVGQISSGKTDIKQFTVCMQKTLLNRAKKDVNIKKMLKSVGCLMVDEAHRAVAKDYQTLISYIDAPVRLAFSGTPKAFDDHTKKVKLTGMFGKTVFKVSNKFLIDKGYSQRPIIKIYDVKECNIAPLSYREDYEDNLMFSKKRISTIAKLLLERQDRQVLITFTEIEHGEFMLNKLLLEEGMHSSIAMVSGEDKHREEKLERFANREIKVLIASMIVKEGLNIPCIRTIMMAQGGKSVITIKQITGRGLRHDGENDDFELIDFYDSGKYIREHSKTRFKIYENEDFDIEYQYNASKLGIPYGT